MISQQDFANNCTHTLYTQLDFPIYEYKDTTYSQTNIPHPLLNGVLSCKTSDTEIKSVVQKIIAHFKNQNLPHSWWVESKTAPSSLRSILEKEGLTCLGDFSVLVLNISCPQALKDFDSDARLEVVTGEPYLSSWGKVLGSSFQISSAAMTIFLEIMKKSTINGKFTNVMAVKDEQAVATGSITCTPEGAYICNDTTLEEKRNLGYGKAVTTKLLKVAAELGSKRVAVISSPLDAEDYKSLGFVEESVYQIYA